MRVVWQVDLEDISATHMHPADMRGTIVSLDRSEPYGSWRWGGQQWLGQIGSGPPGRLAGVALAVAEPRAVAERWAEVLGVAVEDGAQPLLALDGAEVRFEPLAGRAEGLVEIAVATPTPCREAPTRSSSAACACGGSPAPSSAAGAATAQATRRARRSAGRGARGSWSTPSTKSGAVNESSISRSASLSASGSSRWRSA